MMKMVAYLSLRLFLVSILLFDNGTAQNLTLTSTVSGDLCDGESATFTCTGRNTVYNWFIFGLNGEGDIVEALARSLPSGRFSTTDAAGGIPESNLMISGFTTADNGTVIYCADVNDPTVFSSTNITIGVGPFNLTQTSSSSSVNSISLSWDCVGSGCRPTQYMIKWSESGMTVNQINTSDMSYTIRELDGCTNYSIAVETQICGGHSLNEDIQTVELIRNDVCRSTPIILTVTVVIDGENFTHNVTFEPVNEVYVTDIPLPVGSSYTAEVCAVTSVGRGKCTTLSGIASPPPTTSKGGLSDAVKAGIGVGEALICILVIVVVVCIVIWCYYQKKKRNVGIKGSQERDHEGATHTKVDPDTKKKQQEGMVYADLKFDNSQPKPPPPQSKKEVEMVTYAVVDNTKKDKPEGNNE